MGAAEQPKGEELVATINSIVIKLEASVGRRTVPMLTVDASMEAVVKDWSSQVRKQFIAAVQSGRRNVMHCIHETTICLVPWI